MTTTKIHPTHKAIAITTRVFTVVAIVAIGVAVLVALEKTKPEAPKEDEIAPPRRVAALEVSRQTVRRPWRGYGTARAVDSADVPARVSATVVAIPDDIEEGKPVERGQLLVQLDTSDFERAAETARQQLAEIDTLLTQIQVEQDSIERRYAIEVEDQQLAENEFDRVQGLFEREAATQRELDASKRAVLAARRAAEQTREQLDRIIPRRAQIQTQRAAAVSALARAQDDLERTRIVSPIDGILQTVDVEVGENVPQGQRIARVVSLARIETPLKLAAAALHEVAVGQPATLTATNGVGTPWHATIARIAPEADPNSRTITVFVEVEQPHAADAFTNSPSNSRANFTNAQPDILTPGMFVSGVVLGRELAPQWVVPRRAARGGRLMTARDGLIVTIPIQVRFIVEGTIEASALPDDQWAVIDGPLQTGQLIIVDGSLSLLDGERVNPQVTALPQQTAGQLKSQEASP